MRSGGSNRRQKFSRSESLICKQRQQELGHHRSHTMECELAIDWVIQHSTTQAGGPTGCTPVVDAKPNTPSRLAFQTDACFTCVIEASCCDYSIHGGRVLIARHLQEPSKTNWSGSKEGVDHDLRQLCCSLSGGML